MQLQLVRYCYGPDSVAGLLKYGENLSLSLWTLECPWRENQIFSSCIPDGSYPLVKFDSVEHPLCWVITPVPSRTGILIHPGNTVDDTQGCILVGQSQSPGWVGQSQDALRQLNYTLDRNVQHTITLGSGLGAVLMPTGVPDDANGNDRGISAVPDSPGGSD